MHYFEVTSELRNFALLILFKKGCSIYSYNADFFHASVCKLQDMVKFNVI